MSSASRARRNSSSRSARHNAHARARQAEIDPPKRRNFARPTQRPASEYRHAPAGLDYPRWILPTRVDQHCLHAHPPTSPSRRSSCLHPESASRCFAATRRSIRPAGLRPSSTCSQRWTSSRCTHASCRISSLAADDLGRWRDVESSSGCGWSSRRAAPPSSDPPRMLTGGFARVCWLSVSWRT